MGTPRPRRATPADTAAVAALAPAILLTESDDRAVFVLDDRDGHPVAAIDFARMSDHITVEHLVGSRRERRGLLAHAAAAVRAMGLRELRWPGFRGGRKHIRNGPVQRAGDYLDNLGVPVWRDGSASLPQTLYFRGTWAAVALLIGFGSIVASLSICADLTLAHIVVPALLAPRLGLRDPADRPLTGGAVSVVAGHSPQRRRRRRGHRRGRRTVHDRPFPRSGFVGDLHGDVA
jgi:hypothetical protein